MRDSGDFKNRYRIRATLRFTTALSVGSRAFPPRARSDLPVMKTPDGVPYIPGSSLKGVVRAHTERLLRTMGDLKCRSNGERLWACDPLDETGRCVTATRKQQLVEKNKRDGRLDDKGLTEDLWAESCTACRLFGSPWLASRVLFQDAMLINHDSLLRLTEVRDGVGIDRDLGAARARIKYDFETVPAGSEFGFHVIVENADEWEVGLLLTALQALQEGLLPVGGRTSRGLGWGTLDALRIERLTAEDLLGHLMGDPMPTVEEDALRTAFIEALSQGG